MKTSARSSSREMIERLAISDLVLADVSIPNGNVYYEVGIRHAAQRQGCIMTAATWSKPLFDIDQMRQIRYPLPAESISDETAAEIIKIVQAAIPKMADGDSPFYQVFPKYPDYDPARATSFRKSLEELSKFQAEIIAARSASRRRVPYARPGAPRTLLYGRADPEGRGDRTAVHPARLHRLEDDPGISSMRSRRISATRPW